MSFHLSVLRSVGPLLTFKDFNRLPFKFKCSTSGLYDSTGPGQRKSLLAAVSGLLSFHFFYFASCQVIKFQEVCLNRNSETETKKESGESKSRRTNLEDESLMMGVGLLERKVGHLCHFAMAGCVTTGHSASFLWRD